MALVIYIDEDSCETRLIAALRRLGMDVVAAEEVGRRGVPDEDHLVYSCSLGRPILTRNLIDFSRLHAEWARSGREHTGIIIWILKPEPPEAVATALFRLLSPRGEAQLQNAILYI